MDTGAVEISREAIRQGVEFLAVATTSEAMELRKSGILAPVLLLIPPEDDEFPTVVKNDISTVVFDLDHIDRALDAAQAVGKQAKLHIKIDSGMGRIGCRPSDAVDICKHVITSDRLKLEGTCTHFAAADSMSSQYTDAQIAIFGQCLSDLESAGIYPGTVHAANSAGIIQHRASHFDMIRPGILAYGYPPAESLTGALKVTPVMELKSRIIQIKKVPIGTPISYGLTYKTTVETYIATVAVGYADGYSRLLSNRGRVAIGGKRYPVIGTVCMDQIMVDLGPQTSVMKSDEVTLFGPDEPAPDAGEIAKTIGTIPYEVTCGICDRVPRVFVGGAS